MGMTASVSVTVEAKGLNTCKGMKTVWHLVRTQKMLDSVIQEYSFPVLAISFGGSSLDVRAAPLSLGP